jgi:hypothetical protein
VAPDDGVVERCFFDSGGGMQLDGQQILQEGLEEYKQWKEDLIYKFSAPLSITMG